MYLLLAVHWVLFVNYGESDFKSFDWYLIHQWLDVVVKSLNDHVFPYEVQLWDPSGPQHDLFGSKYFAMPFLNVSPQVLLLGFVSIETFITIQILIAMTVSFWSILKWQKTVGLSLFATCLVILLWILNGALVARMGVGHIQLTGYFFIPLYLLVVKNFFERMEPGVSIHEKVKWTLILALVLFVVLIQGSVHTVFQMALIFGIIPLVKPRSFPYVVAGCIAFLLMAGYFILPNISHGTVEMTTGGHEMRVVFGGYGVGFSDELEMLTGIQLPPASLQDFSLKNSVSFIPTLFVELIAHVTLSLVYPFTASLDSSWEYSIYVGPIGFVLIVFGLKWYWKLVWENKQSVSMVFSPERILGLGVLLLSLSVVSSLLWSAMQSVVPLNAIDRLPTRIILYPLFGVFIYAALGLDRFFLNRTSRNIYPIKVLTVGMLAISLLFHSSGWSFNSVSYISRESVVDARLAKPLFDTRILEPLDNAYVQSVQLGILITSLSVLSIVLYLFFQARKFGVVDR